MSLRLSGTILGCGRSAGAVIPALGSGRYSPGPNIGLPSWRKGSALNFTTNVVWGQPGALATVSVRDGIHPHLYRCGPLPYFDSSVKRCRIVKDRIRLWK